jgi:tetratricopeptide (TPR) repeat protein
MCEYEKALDLYCKVNNIELQKSELNQDSLNINYNNIAVARLNLSQYKDAKEALDHSITYYYALGNTKHPVIQLLNTGKIQLLTNKFEDALESYKSAYEAAKTASIDETKDKDLEYIYLAFSNYYLLQHENEKAIDFAKKAEDINGNFSTYENIDLVHIKIQLGKTYQNMNKFNEVIELYNSALEIISKLQFENNFMSGKVMILKGITYLSMAKYAQCIQSITDGLERVRKIIPNDSLEIVIQAYIALASLYLQCKVYNEATSYAKKAYDLSDNIFKGEKNLLLASAADIYGLCLVYENKKEAGYNLINLALDNRTVILGKDNYEVVNSYNTLARYYNHIGNHNSALLKIMSALDIISSATEEENFHERTINFYKNYADLSFHLKKYQDSFHFYEKAIDLQTKISDENSLIIVEIYKTLADLKSVEESTIDSHIYLKKAVEAYKKIVAENEKEGKIFVEVLNELIQKLRK